MEACLETVGRRREEYSDTLIIDPFLNDFNKLLNSKSNRRLPDKAQVMSLYKNPHVRTRDTHTKEVMAVALTIAECLGLNKNLCIAIALGHDIGHTPYGHVGERVISKFWGKQFKHYINSVIIAQKIERKGFGLNLTYETLEGILKHSRGAEEFSTEHGVHQEYSAVMFADKISYIFSDVNDLSLRSGYISDQEVEKFVSYFGKTHRERNKTVLTALIKESKQKGCVSFVDSEEAAKFNELKNFMYNEAYSRVDFSIQELILTQLCEYFSKEQEFADVNQAIAVSLLTDQEVNDFGKILLSCSKPSLDQIKHWGLFEILPCLKGKKIDYTDPDLNREDFKYK